jgi:eukaryotic-like serine/threonine-protein kinase
MRDVRGQIFARVASALAHRYHLERELGAGGMATVYLARDLKHERDVAIKVLRPELAASLGADRFFREIHVAAQLQHPHILTLIDSGEADGLLYYVMPYVDGESLRAKLAREGELPVTETVRVLRDVSDALSHAHAHGVVHRDVKPENVMLSGRHALVMDFGVAKAVSEAAGRQSLTSVGVAVGTPAYMAPEQAAADAHLDHRADIYALGVLGYEMLTGRAPFARATAQATLAAQVTEAPEAVSKHRPGIPAGLGALIMRCLEKRPADRWQSASEILRQLEGLATPVEGTAAAVRPWRGPRSWVVGVAVVTLLAGAVLVGSRARWRPPHRQPKLAQLTFRQGVQQYPAWSPDGKQLAYTAEAGGVRKIFLKRPDAGQETQLTGGQYDDLQPAWSPDGQAVLFVRAQRPSVRLEPGDVFGEYEGGDIWALDLRSRQEVKLLENGFDPAYSPDGRHIALDASWAGPRRIWVVDNRGHNPQQVTADTSEAVSHVRPHWSPDGTKVVFQNIERTNFNTRIVDLASGRTVRVTTGLFHDLNPVWAPGGKLIYFTSDRGGGYNLWRVPVGSDGSPSDLPQQVTNGGGQDVDPAISADGTRLAFAILRQNADIWRLPVSRESGKPTGPPEAVIATTREDSRGAWSPDLTRIVFNSDRGGQMNIWLYALADGSTRQLTQGSGGDFQPNWSPDGTRIVFFSSRSGTLNIWTVAVEGGQLAQLTRTPSIDVNPFFSPDGNRIAYQSDRSGRLEVWIMNADGSDARQLTSTGVMGHFLRWTADGRAVVFRCPCGGKPRTLQVPVVGGTPEPVGEVVGGSHMSFSPDHSRIMDVVGHKTLWVSPLRAGKPEKVFTFDDPDVRIDYPVWSPDGKWVLFDRFRPQGGDIWVIQDFE